MNQPTIKDLYERLGNVETKVDDLLTWKSWVMGIAAGVSAAVAIGWSIFSSTLLK